MTTIQWTEATLNPTTGCDRVSPGCDNCYALTMAKRLKGMGSAKYQNDGDPRTSGPGFGITTHDDVIYEPLTWRKPRRVFVNSMSDLFHQGVPDEFIARVFAVMSLTPQHTYQILSKRHARMRSLLSSPAFPHRVAQQIDALAVDLDHNPVERWEPIPGYEKYEASSHGQVRGPQGPLATGVNPRTGRESVTLWNSGEPKTLTVHRLVLMAHSPGGDPLLEACHRNGDKTDNRLANLRWGTRSDNQQEKVRHGSRGGPQKITAEKAQQIREARKSGLTQQAVADRFGVSRPLVSMIETGKVWAGPGITWPLPNVWLGVSVEDQKWADIRIPALLDTPAAVRFISAEPLLGPITLDMGDPHRGHEDDDVHGAPHPRVCLTCSTEDNEVEYYRREPDSYGIDWVILGGESGPGARPLDPDWIRAVVTECQEAGVAAFVKQLGSVWARGHGADKKGGDPQHWPADLRVREYPKTAVPM